MHSVHKEEINRPKPDNEYLDAECVFTRAGRDDFS